MVDPEAFQVVTFQGAARKRGVTVPTTPPGALKPKMDSQFLGLKQPRSQYAIPLHSNLAARARALESSPNLAPIERGGGQQVVHLPVP